MQRSCDNCSNRNPNISCFQCSMKGNGTLCFWRPTVELFEELEQMYVKASARADAMESGYRELRSKIKEIVRYERAIKLLQDIVDDLYVPHRLGLGEAPNPNWDTLNNIQDFLKKVKDANKKD